MAAAQDDPAFAGLEQGMASLSFLDDAEQARARAELARAKAEFGITDTENAAATWVRDARGGRDAALATARKLRDQRDYWRSLALKGDVALDVAQEWRDQRNAWRGLVLQHGGGGGGGEAAGALRQRREMDAATDAKLDSLYSEFNAAGDDARMAARRQAQDATADRMLAEGLRSAKRAPARDAPLELFNLHRIPAAAAGAAGGAAQEETESTAVSSLAFLANYYQQMALVTTRLVENGLQASSAPTDDGGTSGGGRAPTQSPWAREFLERVIPAMQDELSHERLLASTRQREARAALGDIRSLLSHGDGWYYDADGAGGGFSPDDDGAQSPGSPLARSGSLAHRGGGRVPFELKFDLNTPLREAGAASSASAAATSGGARGTGAAGGGGGDADAGDDGDGADDDAATLDDLIKRRVLAALADSTEPPAVGSLVVVDYFRTARVVRVVGAGAGAGAGAAGAGVEVKYTDDGTRETVLPEQLIPYLDTPAPGTLVVVDGARVAVVLGDRESKGEDGGLVLSVQIKYKDDDTTDDVRPDRLAAYDEPADDNASDLPAQPDMARHASMPVTNRDRQRVSGLDSTRGNSPHGSPGGKGGGGGSRSKRHGLLTFKYPI